MPTTLWLQVALGFIPTPQCVARVIDPLRERAPKKDPIWPPDCAFAYPEEI